MEQCSETSAYKIDVEFLHLSAYEGGTECSETSAYKIVVEILHLSAYEYGTDRVFRNVGI
jgi:hypothetical protein